MLTEQPDRAGPDELSDADLIRRSLADPDCFAPIFDRHAEEILRYARARLGPDLAEDVAAETFVAAFRHRDRYDTTRPDARPWLYGIAVRQIGRHRRALARQLRLLRSAPAEPVTEDFGPRAAERVTAEQLRPQLGAVLAGLPGADRELLLALACGCGGHGRPVYLAAAAAGTGPGPGGRTAGTSGVGREGLRRYLESSQHAADERRVAHRIG